MGRVYALLVRLRGLRGGVSAAAVVRMDCRVVPAGSSGVAAGGVPGDAGGPGGGLEVAWKAGTAGTALRSLRGLGPRHLVAAGVRCSAFMLPIPEPLTPSDRDRRVHWFDVPEKPQPSARAEVPPFVDRNHLVAGNGHLPVAFRPGDPGRVVQNGGAHHRAPGDVPIPLRIVQGRGDSIMTAPAAHVRRLDLLRGVNDDPPAHQALRRGPTPCFDGLHARRDQAGVGLPQEHRNELWTGTFLLMAPETSVMYNGIDDEVIIASSQEISPGKKVRIVPVRTIAALEIEPGP